MPTVPFPTRLQRLLRAMILLLMPGVLVIGAVRIVVSDHYMAFEYGKAGFPADPFGLTMDQRVA